MCRLSWVISDSESRNQTGQTPRLSLLHVWHWDTILATGPISEDVYVVATIEIVDSHGPVHVILLHTHHFTTCFCCYYHFFSHCNCTTNLAGPLLSRYIQRSYASSICSEYLAVAYYVSSTIGAIFGPYSNRRLWGSNRAAGHTSTNIHCQYHILHTRI